ncbi:hypothetical protein FQA39_LY08227 [Lamprigera yunnana]|nr:hypothetical protein FQA39_LY08227 [Lamprigera yunnana]
MNPEFIIKLHLKDIQSQYELNVNLINELMTTCNSHAQFLNKCNLNDLDETEQYINLRSFQVETLRMLFKINFDLEKQNVIGASLLKKYRIDRIVDEATVSYEAKSGSNCSENKMYSENEIRANNEQPQDDFSESCSEKSSSELPNDLQISDDPSVLTSIQSNTSKEFKTIETLNEFENQTSSSTQLVPEEIIKQVSDNVNSITLDDQKELVKANKCEIRNRIDPHLGDCCAIGCVTSPSNFYIQVADKYSATLDEMANELEMTANHNCRNITKMEAMANLGNFYTSEIDYYWYRVEVLDWMPNAVGDCKNQIVVQLIDYGDIFNISYKHLFEMPEKYYDIPKMAQLCHLTGLYPVGSSHQNLLDKWSQESIDGFFKICGNINGSIYKIRYISDQTVKGSFGIDLIKCDETDHEKILGELMLEQQLAVEIFSLSLIQDTTMMKQILTAQGLENIQPNMSTNDVLDVYFTQNGIKEHNNINEAVMGYDPRDETYTCANLRSDGTCYKGKKCKQSHIPLKDGYTRDKQAVYNKAFVDIQIPCVNDEVFVIITHVLSVQHFYIQIRSNHYSKQNECPFKTLKSEMNKPEVIKLYRTLDLAPGLSELVIVKHPINCWYRGQVMDVVISPNGTDFTADIFMVDVGDILTVTNLDLRKMLPEFLEIPFQVKNINSHFSVNTMYTEQINKLTFFL